MFSYVSELGRRDGPSPVRLILMSLTYRKPIANLSQTTQNIRNRPETYTGKRVRDLTGLPITSPICP